MRWCVLKKPRVDCILAWSFSMREAQFEAISAPGPVFILKYIF